MRSYINKNLIIAILLVLYTAFSGYVPEPDPCVCKIVKTYGCKHRDMCMPQTGNSDEKTECSCANLDYKNTFPDIEYTIPESPAVKTKPGSIISYLNIFNELTSLDNLKTGFTNLCETMQGKVSLVSIPLLI